jgi:putative tryptophan/tyrosine transport system substrate-binding protein
MRRREFITLLGGVSATWPLAAHAQRPERMRRIGVLIPTTEDDPQQQRRIAGFLQGLQQLGWMVGRDLLIEYRWSGAVPDDVRRSAAELVALSPDVVFASGNTTVAPLLQVTRTVPIVFATVPDPVGAGFVDSLARPGGNANRLYPFRIQHRREMAGATQADRTGPDASGSRKGCRDSGRDRPVRSYPSCGPITSGGSQADQRARRQ